MVSTFTLLDATHYNSAAMQDVVTRHLDIDSHGFVSREMLLARLTAIVRKMMQQDPQQLIQVLYRLDVPEQKALPIMERAGEDSDLQLAELMLQRYEQIVASRLQHKSNRPGLEDDDLSW